MILPRSQADGLRDQWSRGYGILPVAAVVSGTAATLAAAVNAQYNLWQASADVFVVELPVSLGVIGTGSHAAYSVLIPAVKFIPPV